MYLGKPFCRYSCGQLYTSTYRPTDHHEPLRPLRRIPPKLCTKPRGDVYRCDVGFSRSRHWNLHSLLDSEAAGERQHTITDNWNNELDGRKLSPDDESHICQHRFKIPHFSVAVVSLLLLSDSVFEGPFHVLQGCVTIPPYGVLSSCSCRLGC